MSRQTDLAWAAGAFEGRGSINTVQRKQQFKPTLQITLNRAGSTELLDRFKSVVNGGRIYGPYKPINPNQQAQYKWRANGQEARRIYWLLEPYLSQGSKTRFSAVDPICV